MRKKWIAIGLAISSFLITTSPYLSISADPLSDLQAQKNASNQKISELEEKREEMVSDFTAYDRKMLREFENNHRLIASKQEELEQREATLSEQEQLFAQKQTELFDSITEQQKQLKNTNSEIKIQKERPKTIQQQINAMLAYESFYNNQYDPNSDNYNAANAVLNGYSSGNWLFFRVDKEHKINGTHMGVSVFY